MRKSYDFRALVPAEPKYFRHLRRSVTVRIDTQVISYFKSLARRTGLSYQSLMNFVLHDYASKGLAPSANWRKPARRRKAA